MIEETVVVDMIMSYRKQLLGSVKSLLQIKQVCIFAEVSLKFEHGNLPIPTYMLHLASLYQKTIIKSITFIILRKAN